MPTSAVTVNFRVTGVKDVMRVFEYSRKQIRVIMRDSQKEAAPVIREEIKRLTPRQKKKRNKPFRGQSPTVRLKNKTQTRAGKRSRVLVSRTIGFATRARMKIAPGARWFYPFQVEYGRQAGTKGGQARPYRMASRGLSRSQLRAKRIITKHVSDAVALLPQQAGIPIGRRTPPRGASP